MLLRKQSICMPYALVTVPWQQALEISVNIKWNLVMMQTANIAHRYLGTRQRTIGEIPKKKRLLGGRCGENSSVPTVTRFPLYHRVQNRRRWGNVGRGADHWILEDPLDKWETSVEPPVLHCSSGSAYHRDQ